MGIPYQNEAVAITTTANPAVGAVVGAGLQLADTLGILRGKTTHIEWNSANAYAQKVANALKPYIRSLLNDSQIRASVPSICRRFREQRNLYWTNTKNADIDRSITEFEQRAKDDVQGALHGLLWLLQIWVNTCIPADGTGYEDHSRTLFALIFLKAFEENGFTNQSSTIWNSVKFAPLWSVTIAGKSAPSDTGGVSTASIFGGDGGNLLIGIVIVGFVIGLIAMKGGKA